MAKAHYLSDSKGNKIYPYAHTKAVYDEEGKALETRLEEIELSVPTELSGLTDDATHRLVSDTEKSTWNGKADKATTLAGYGITDAMPSNTTHLSGDIAATEKGANNGVATLGSDGKVPSSQLPSYVDDVVEYDNKASFPSTGESGKIYVDKATNLTWRWSGSAYVEISPSIGLGETSSTAYAGDKGKAVTDGLATHKADTTSHITAAERTAWNGKGSYSKPSGGIPKTDLASAVQTSLGKADSALQSYTETDPVFSASAASGIKSTDITNWNGKTSNTGTVTSVSVKMNNTTKGTVTSSGAIDLGTVITAHQDISGKVDKVSGKGLSTNDYTTTEKNKLAGIASGATANTGTVTSVAVKMNGATKGTVTSSGTIDLGTVVTDISGKQNITDNSLATTAKTVPGAINELNSKFAFSTICPLLNLEGDWRLAPYGISMYKYENNATACATVVPHPYIIIVVFRNATNRGAALGITWNHNSNGLYLCGLHDVWGDWRQV